MTYKLRKQFNKIIATTPSGGELEESWFAEDEKNEKHDIVYALTDKKGKLIDVYTDYNEAIAEFNELVAKETKANGKRKN